jgi:uncharacterized membrane protein YoaK (UPF0700 family)
MPRVIDKEVSRRDNGTMFKQGFHHDLPFRVVWKWFLLSFLSGSVNAGGFMAVQRFVTHVTGFATLFGVEVAKDNLQGALGILSVPIYFLMGAMLSAYFIDRRYQQGKKPRYALVMSLVGVCLALAALGGHFKLFGVFGETLNLKQDYSLLVLLSLASGLQNAAISTASNGVVRTTHLTGPATDLGIGITRVLFRHQDPTKHELDKKNLLLKGSSITSFIAGSVVGAILFMKFEYLGFLMPSGIAFFTAKQALGLRHQKI